MATISNLNVKLTAGIGSFVSTMSKALKPIQSLGRSVASLGGKVTGLAGGLVALAAGAGMVALVKSSMESIDATAKLSDRLGITTEALTGLQHAANLSGISAEGLTGGLEKMLKNLSEAAQGSNTASAAFAKLGLDGATLANMAPDEAFKQIADRLAAIRNPAERAGAAMEIFGKAGQGLLPLMMSGSEGIAAAQAEAERLGLTFSRVDAAKVEAANDSLTRMQAVFVGVAQTIAIQLAPFIDAAAGKLTAMAAGGEGMGPRIVGAVEWVAGSLARVADFLNVLKAGWHAMRVVASTVLWGLLKPIDAIIQGLDFLYQKLFKKGPSAVAKASADFMREIEKNMKGSFDAAGDAMLAFSEGRNAAAVAKAFDDIRGRATANAQAVADNAAKMRGAAASTEDWAQKLKDAEANARKVTDTLADLQRQVDQSGMTDGQKKLADLSALGATPEQLAAAKSSLDRLDQLAAGQKRWEEMQGRAKSVIESVQTPLQQYDQTIGELNELLGTGLLSWDQYGRAVRDARNELEGATKVEMGAAPEAFKAGSAAAQRLRFENGRGADRMARDDAPRQMVAKQDQTNRILERIERGAGGAEVFTIGS